MMRPASLQIGIIGSISPCSSGSADSLDGYREIESWSSSLLLSLSSFDPSIGAPTFGPRTIAEEFTPFTLFTPSASRNRRCFWKENGRVYRAILGRNATARFSTSNVSFSRILLIYISPQPVMFRNVLLIGIPVIHACLTEARRSGQLARLHTTPRNDIMANDDLIFCDSSHFGTPQHGDITTYNVSLNRTVPIFGTFDGPSETRARSRHHFRRGAISEASGQFLLPLVDGECAAAQTLLCIKSITENEIEIIFVPPNNRQSHNYNSTSQTQIDCWRELADQIHRGLVNISNPTLQQQINETVATLHSPTTNRPSQNRPAMEGDGRASQPNPYRDTYRYGREGWPTVDLNASNTTRPATIPGSNFAVPDSTLNLFQSIDIFAPPPPRRSTLDHIRDVNAETAMYFQHIRNLLNDTVAAVHNGRNVPPGMLFTLSMEVSRVSQLLTILVTEYNETLRAQQAAARSMSNSRDNGHSQDQLSNDDITESALHTWTDDDSSSSESGEPEGWSNIGFVFDGDYPHEVCFHIGTQQVTFPMEVVENWMMDAQNWDRLEVRTAEFNRRSFDQFMETGTLDSILHCFARPESVRSRRPIVRTTSYEDFDDSSEDDDSDYEDSEYRQAEPVSFFSDSGDDMTDTEIEAEEQEDEDEERDEMQSHVDSQDSPDAEGNAQGQDPAQAPVVHHSLPRPPAELDAHTTPRPSIASSQYPVITESYIRTRLPSDESNNNTINTSEQEDEAVFVAPHPIHDWTPNHTLFTFSCRGSLFHVAYQVQQAFGFQPSVNADMIGQRLNSHLAAHHRSFVFTYLPGEHTTRRRAYARASMHRFNTSNEDIYYGTHQLPEADVGSEGYARPPMPGTVPDCWNRNMDVCLLLDLNRGRFNFETFWNRHRSTLGGTPLSAMRDFMGIRLAQIRFLGITQVELAAAHRGRSWGRSE